VCPARLDGTPAWVKAKDDAARRSAQATFRAAEDKQRERRRKLEAEAAAKGLTPDELEQQFYDKLDRGLWRIRSEAQRLINRNRSSVPVAVPTLAAAAGRNRAAREPRRRRATRTVGARGDPSESGADEPPPGRLYELGRLDVASVRLWARVRRREAKNRLAAA
jgi:hypothetical protein